MRWFTRLGPALLLALGLAAGPTVMIPAAAHGGEIDVELGTDGAGGISAALTWAGDGHPVEESATVVVRAVSGSGTKVGPVTLASAAEGVGWYRSDAALLDEGHWTVTAQVKKPQKTKVTTEIDVAAPPEAPESDGATSGDASEESETEQSETESETEESGPGSAEAAANESDSNESAQAGGLPGWVGWAIAACAVVAVVSVVVLRKRTT